MGAISRFIQRRGISPSYPDRWLLSAFGAVQTEAGVYVDENTALSSSAIWAGVRTISESLSTVPLHVYRANPDGSRVIARDHPLDGLLSTAPNSEMTAQEWRSQMVAALILAGNSYSEIVRDGGGRIRQIWPLSWYRVDVERAQDDSLYYKISVVGLDDVNDRQTVAVIPFERMLHIRAFNSRGLIGESTINKLRQTIGISLATEAFGARFYGSGSTLAGVLSHPGSLSEGAQKRLRDSWNERYSGLSNSHRIAILEEGMKWEPIGVPPDASQFLETRQFQIQEAARALNIPPHMLRDLSKATYANVEQQAIEFVQHTLRPWAVILEQRMQFSLLTEAERRAGYYIRHSLEGLLRGDIKTRYDSYAIARNWGWLSVNDIRRLEDLNPIESGNIYLQPLNMVEAGGSAPAPAVPADRAQALRELRATDFPTAGDDETVSLANSAYALPPLDYIENIRENYPSIWARGGNVEGNRSDRILREIRERGLAADELSPTQIDKIREREAWSARHFEDFQLPGVVAQLKWHMVGSRGFGHMRETINEAIDRLEENRSERARADLERESRAAMHVRSKIRDAFRPLLLDAAQSVVAGEVRAIRKAVREEFRGVDSFRAWVEGFYGPAFAERVMKAMGPIVRAYQEQVATNATSEIGGEDPWPAMQNWVASYITALAGRYSGYSSAQLIRLLENIDPDRAADQILELADHWERTRADDVAREESVRAGQAALRVAYAALGIVAMRWVADADPCPYCSQMNGRTVTMSAPFATDADSLEAEGQPALKLFSNILHPPLHRGCECSMMAAR